MPKLYPKKFKISEVLYRASDRTHHMICCSPDGDAWQVAVDRLPDWEYMWRVGLVIEIATVLRDEGQEDRAMVPDFASAFGDQSAQRVFYPNPFNAVARIWGNDDASKHFPPEARLEPMESNTPPPAAATPRKRRGRKDGASPTGPADGKA